MSDTSTKKDSKNNVIEIGVSRRRCLFGLASAAALSLFFAVLLLEYDRGQDHWASFGFAFLMAVYALSAITSIWYLVWAPAAIITISSDGVRDVRISADFIHWPAIKHITTTSSNKWFASAVLVLDKEFAGTPELKLTARMAGPLNRIFGIDGIVVSHQLLDVSAVDLLNLLKEHSPPRPGKNGRSPAKRPPGREPVQTTIVLSKRPGSG